MSEEDTTATESEAVEEAVEDNPTPNESDESPEDENDKDDDDAWNPDRARKKIAKLNREAANLRKRVTEDAATKDQKITELERTALRYDVAFDLGLPKQIAMRLQGNTREEMLEDAQQLVDLIAPAKRPTQKPTEALRGGLQPEAEPEETDLKKLGARMFER